MLVAADLIGELGDLDGLVEVGGVESSISVSSACSYSGIIARSSLRTSAHRNGSASVPRTRFIDRRAVNDGSPVRRNLSLRSRPSDRSIGGWRWYVTFVFGPADRLVLRLRLGQQRQPGDLVLVLVRHQLVEIAGGGLGQRLRARHHAALGGADLVDRVAEALGVVGVLVVDEIGGEAVRSADRASPACAPRAGRPTRSTVGSTAH